MYYFIANIHGASGKALLTWKKVKKILIEKKIQFKTLLSTKIGDGSRYAREICSNDDSEKNIVVVGGDGTINEVLNGITDFSKVKFGVIPTGSGNDFCRGVGIKRGLRNTKKVLEKILSSQGEKLIDLGKVCADGITRYFGISSGIGMDAIVTKKVNESKLKSFLNKIGLGGTAYILITLKTLATMKFYKIKAIFDEAETKSFEKLIFLSGMNLKAEGGGVKMAPKALKDDGKLTVCAVNGIPRGLVYFAFPFLIFGLHSKLKGFTVKKFSTIEVFSETPLVLHTDGEYVGDVKHIKWEILPSVLKILN